MKKLALVLALITLVAAGCDTTNDQPNTQLKNDQQSSPVIPKENPDSSLQSPEINKPETKVTPAPNPAPKLNPTPTPPPPKPSSPPTPQCDPNYSGCVPLASDVDCAGGSGNGPTYVRGPVNVIGYDKYDLDRDGDGIACE